MKEPMDITSDVAASLRYGGESLGASVTLRFMSDRIGVITPKGFEYDPGKQDKYLVEYDQMPHTHMSQGWFKVYSLPPKPKSVPFTVSIDPAPLSVGFVLPYIRVGTTVVGFMSARGFTPMVGQTRYTIESLPGGWFRVMDNE